MDLPQQRTNTAVHAAPGQQVYVTVDTGGHMASPAQVYFDQVSLKKNSLCSFLRFVDKGVVSYALKILIRLIRQRQYANHLGPKSENRILDSADFWGVFNS